MDLRTKGPIFLPIPDGHIANVVTFGKSAIIVDYQLYIYRTWIPMPQDDEINLLLDKLVESQLVPAANDEGQYVIHQSNCSWVGSGFKEFRDQLVNQRRRYESVPNEFEMDRYKAESALFYILLNTGDYLVINVDPWVRLRDRGEYARKQFRNFEVRVLLDGLPLNGSRLNELLEDTGLRFDNGQLWEPKTQKLAGRAISNVEVEVLEEIEDEEGYVHHVVCRNPLYGKKEFLNRFFPKKQNIVSEYEYVIASCDPLVEKTETATVDNISVTDYSKVGRHTTQNLSMGVTFQ